ncbi:GNAT family N-acetyltransferase [Colwellia sp. MEBiC06753]
MSLSITYPITFQHEPDKRVLKQFYKAQQYSAKFKGFDHAFTASKNDQVIAACIYSQLVMENTQLLLHALVVDNSFRGQGVASKLITFSQQTLPKHFDQIVCFSQPYLNSFYQSNAFAMATTEQLAPFLAERYNAYLKNQKDLQVFLLRRN